ncbi:MAG: rod shape-determining protein RodA [Clostridiaceae bacterium]|nr:rod shape-determining protein RodA [Clostridiaceae bacterium]
MKKRILKNIEWGILICTILLIVIGLVSLYSATYESEQQEFKKQLLWLAISIPAMILIICINYEVIAKISPIFYGILLILLTGVLFTESVNGASSWFSIGFFSFQPSEFAKIFVILTFSVVITKIQERGREEINRPTRLLICLAVIAVPVLLIIKQPDYGTALAFLVATIFILFSAGINKKYIICTILAIIIIAPLLYFFVLPEHAKSRIDVFLNPNLDPRGAGYNIIQSKLAVGSGQLFGMGILKGNQTQLGFLYPKTTDFIFAVIGEEMGFVVTAGIVIVYVILITKAIYIAKTAKDDLGSYISMGIAGIFLFHMVENIGMTIGLLPITGVPLPFVSYGGSSLLTNLILISLLLNISGRRQKAIFIE